MRENLWNWKLERVKKTERRLGNDPEAQSVCSFIKEDIFSLGLLVLENELKL